MLVFPHETAVDGVPLGLDVHLLEYLLHEVLLCAAPRRQGV